MRLYKNVNNNMLGRMIILNAVGMEQSLADILRMEVRTLKKKYKENGCIKDVQETNKTIKYILYTMTLLDDRIQAGLELIKEKDVK